MLALSILAGRAAGPRRERGLAYGCRCGGKEAGRPPARRLSPESQTCSVAGPGRVRAGSSQSTWAGQWPQRSAASPGPPQQPWKWGSSSLTQSLTLKGEES